MQSKARRVIYLVAMILTLTIVLFWMRSGDDVAGACAIICPDGTSCSFDCGDSKCQTACNPHASCRCVSGS